MDKQDEIKNRQGWRRSPLPTDWKKIRLSILNRDSYKCQVIRHGNKPCPNRATEVDHINGDTDHSDSNLQSICRLCHGRKTQAEGQAYKVAKVKRPKEVHPFLR